LSSTEQVADLLDLIEDPEQRRLIAALAVTDEFFDKKGCLMLIHQFAETIQRRHKFKLMDDKIKAAESQNDHILLNKLLNEKQKLAMRSVKQKMTLRNDT
jgi:DNA primase